MHCTTVKEVDTGNKAIKVNSTNFIFKDNMYVLQGHGKKHRLPLEEVSAAIAGFEKRDKETLTHKLKELTEIRANYATAMFKISMATRELPDLLTKVVNNLEQVTLLWDSRCS